ncbi:MAG TPA: XrtA/PEP-CTERM system histidine kinase PrsK [Casimicrobiaceae bacterium]|nr:XrtA/PEP-CTERM system histidine kinase PrsK [Casimicrobiaceae bacterium]
MSEAAFANAGLWSYGVAAVGFAAFTLRLLLGWRASTRAVLLVAAMAASALWAGSGAFVAYSQTPLAWWSSYACDTLRYATWFLFLGNLLAGGRGRAGDAATGNAALPWWLVAIVVATVAASPFVILPDPFSTALVQRGAERFTARLALAILGLILVEQLIRRVDPKARWGIKPLCVALAAVFALDLYFFADAMLFGRIDPDIWVARGIANALIIPFVAVATARNTGWTIEMHVSRGAVFHSTAIVLSGGFLLAVAAAGYFVRYFGGEWGRALQVELLFAALLVGLLVVSSGTFRSKLRVFISKHFFSYRYDYREEWLRFTRTLSAETSLRGVQEQCIKALADLVESPAGMLWVKHEDDAYRAPSRWNMAAVEGTDDSHGTLPQFLAATGWVVDLVEYDAYRDRYPDLVLPAWLRAFPAPWLVVPLESATELVGFVILAKPRTAIEVNWEVRDLLKTASRQAASYLGQIRATDALLEARKFDAFNRMSAFVVHDLKNLVAQLSLMLKNAERHRDNPEFQRDMVNTVEHVVGRMNKLMLQLRMGTTPVEKHHAIDLAPIVRRVCAAKAGQRTPIDLALDSGIATLGHEDRIEHVIGHLLQNALDATRSKGRIAVRLAREGADVILEVADTGEGMAPEFVRERLFKPFETSKESGMGIGVYESRQYIVSLGGQILYDSAPGAGTRVRVVLPAADLPASPVEQQPKAAV